ncbi:hypothetical protein [Xanthomarina sp. GH4-25]|uniref:hypothetical protein n=1 Tax=Xanthomarina sp. GH4-25 TaxID=3349335 RepID=UPI0038779313
MKKIILLLIAIPFLSFNSNLESIDIIGKWVGEDEGKIAFMTFDKEGYAIFEIQGQIIGGKEFEMEGKKGKMTYIVNPDKTPIEIDLILTKLDTNEQQKILCIAEFQDENNMILAMSWESVRPTEFDSENSIKLKRVE